MGVHTGLHHGRSGDDPLATDLEYQRLRDAARKSLQDWCRYRRLEHLAMLNRVIMPVVIEMEPEGVPVRVRMPASQGHRLPHRQDRFAAGGRLSPDEPKNDITQTSAAFESQH
ncbi:MAG: hypothetical protein H6715_04610 [Myxococcales bacterium]|nr:hypothetical protein [Myxococcales bacterium]